MSQLPEPVRRTDLSPAQVRRAERRQRRTEVAVFGHALHARYQAEVDRLDSQALGDALRCALDEEISLLDYGLARAQGRPVKVELVAGKVEMLAAMNNRRISRRFAE